MFITMYEYISEMQPQVINQLKGSGLLDCDFEPERESEKMTFGDIISLMHHDKWKRVRGAIRQIYPGRVI